MHSLPVSKRNTNIQIQGQQTLNFYEEIIRMACITKKIFHKKKFKKNGTPLFFWYILSETCLHRWGIKCPSHTITAWEVRCGPSLIKPKIIPIQKKKYEKEWQVFNDRINTIAADLDAVNKRIPHLQLTAYSPRHRKH